MAWYLFGAGKGRPVANIAITLPGCSTSVPSGAFGAAHPAGRSVGRASAVARRRRPVVQGVAYFIVIALGTTMYDAVGYLAGSRIGKTPAHRRQPQQDARGPRRRAWSPPSSPS